MKNNDQNDHLVDQIAQNLSKHYVKVDLSIKLDGLKEHMVANSFPAPEKFIPDGLYHTYDVILNEIARRASYFITIEPLELEARGPLLIATYGLLDEGPTYTYSSLKN